MFCFAHLLFDRVFIYFWGTTPGLQVALFPVGYLFLSLFSCDRGYHVTFVCTLELTTLAGRFGAAGPNLGLLCSWTFGLFFFFPGNDFFSIQSKNCPATGRKP